MTQLAPLTIDNVDDVLLIVDILKANWKQENTSSKKPVIRSKFDAPQRQNLTNVVMVYPMQRIRTPVGLGHTGDDIYRSVRIDVRSVEAINTVAGRKFLHQIINEVTRIIRAVQKTDDILPYQYIWVTNEVDYSSRAKGYFWYIFDVTMKHWAQPIR